MQKTNNTPQEVWEVLTKAKSPICCIDMRPDFDAFSSAMAMKYVLEDAGIDLKLTWHSKVLDIYKKYMDTSIIEEEVDPHSIDFTQYDLLLILDSGSDTHLSKKNDFNLPKDITIINIDHHPTNSYYGEYNLVDPEASSTCLILYQMFKELNIELSATVSDLLLFGILHDSGFFQYKTTKSADLRAAADLMDNGADMFHHLWSVTFNESLNSMMIRKLVYSNLVVDKNNNYAYSHILKSELKENELNTDDAPPAADILKRLTEVDFVYVIKQDLNDENLYHVSFRSHEPDYDVSVLAKKLGGGGHKPAAGGEVRNAKSLEEAIKTVKKVIAETQKI